MAETSVPMMHMGCDLLDLLCGGRKGVMGVPFGSIIQVIGGSSSGKSLLKNEIIARNHHDDAEHFEWFSDDCESGDTFDTSDIWGVDIRPIGKDGELHIGKKAVTDSTTIEELDAQVSLFLEYLTNCDKGTKGLYAVDSLDGLANAAREAAEVARLNQLKGGKEVKDPGSYGAELAKFLSQQFLRLKHHKLKEMQCSLLFISQIREKMDALPFQQKWATACGKAMEFYCHTRIFLTTIRKIEKDGRVIGAYVSAKTLKSKTPRPFREVRYTVYFDYGIDNIGSNIDYLFDLLDEKGNYKKDLIDDIKWEPGQDLILDNVKTWLEKEGWTEQCRNDRKEKEGKNTISLDWAKQWANADLENHPERAESFINTFGKSYTRDELIQMCDEDPAMAQELTDRVIAKWEAIEDSVATHRRPKYGNRGAITPDEDAVSASF